MTQPQAILDYASPGRAGRFRVGASSVIRVSDHDGHVEVVETLEKRALAGILIAVDLLLVVAMLTSDPRMWQRLMVRHEVQEGLVFACVVAIAMLGILVYVVKHNWASTRIRASGDGLQVAFRDPFGRRAYELDRARLMQVHVAAEADASPELRILGRDVELRLFTGHPLAELRQIAGAICDAVGINPDSGRVDEPVPYAQVVE